MSNDCALYGTYLKELDLCEMAAEKTSKDQFSDESHALITSLGVPEELPLGPDIQ